MYAGGGSTPSAQGGTCLSKKPQERTGEDIENIFELEWQTEEDICKNGFDFREVHQNLEEEKKCHAFLRFLVRDLLLL